MNQKGFANIVLVIIIVAAIAIGGYFVLTRRQNPITQQTTPPPAATQNPTSQQPSPAPVNETSNWKTYQNSKYGFELKYPPELKLSEKPGSTWTNIIFEKPSFRFTFFAGMREVGGYIGYGTVWAKKISIDSKVVDETLIKCEGDDVTLQIAYTKFDGQTRYDRFDSDCFDKSLIDTFIPQMEAVAKTLKYSE